VTDGTCAFKEDRHNQANKENSRYKISREEAVRKKAPVEERAGEIGSRKEIRR
jgi:hypothetical protein